MARKQNDIPIGAVMFSYVGSDRDFDKFLKAVVHDYLSVSDMSAVYAEKTIAKVEIPAPAKLSIAI